MDAKSERGESRELQGSSPSAALRAVALTSINALREDLAHIERALNEQHSATDELSPALKIAGRASNNLYELTLTLAAGFGMEQVWQALEKACQREKYLMDLLGEHSHSLRRGASDELIANRFRPAPGHTQTGPSSES